MKSYYIYKTCSLTLHLKDEMEWESLTCWGNDFCKIQLLYANAFFFTKTFHYWNCKSLTVNHFNSFALPCTTYLNPEPCSVILNSTDWCEIFLHIQWSFIWNNIRSLQRVIWVTLPATGYHQSITKCLFSICETQNIDLISLSRVICNIFFNVGVKLFNQAAGSYSDSNC